MKGIKLLVSMSQAMMVLLLVCTVLVMLPVTSAKRLIVGDKMGWTTNINYSTWIEGKNFYNGDWIFFAYDRNQMNVLEVNKTDYETCNLDHPIHNWTTGAGRDVVPLNVTRNYYFINGKGFCFGGMKIAINVENYPPPPVAAQNNDESKATFPSLKLHSGRSVIDKVWDAFIQYFWQFLLSSWENVKDVAYHKGNCCFLFDQENRFMFGTVAFLYLVIRGLLNYRVAKFTTAWPSVILLPTSFETRLLRLIDVVET